MPFSCRGAATGTLVAAFLLLSALSACRTTATPQQPVIDLDQAVADEARGDYAAAERQAAAAVALAERTPGTLDDPDMPMLLFFLARQNINRGHFEEAERHLQRARELNGRHYPPAHPQSAALTLLEANLALQLGRAEKAESLARDLLAAQQETYGPRHPFVARSLIVLASAQEGRDDPAAEGADDAALEAARETLEEALEILTNAWGEAHLDVVWTTVSLAHNRAGAGDAAAADALSDKAETLAEQVIRAATAAERQEVETLQADLEVSRGVIDLALDRPAAALARFEAALPRLRRLYGQSHPETAWNRILLGQVLAGLGDFEDAEPHLAEGVEAIRVAHGERHPIYMFALQRRSTAYYDAGWGAEALADWEEARLIRDRLLEIGESL